MYALLKKYGVMHRISTPYHPQTNGQADFKQGDKKDLGEDCAAEQKGLEH